MKNILLLAVGLLACGADLPSAPAETPLVDVRHRCTAGNRPFRVELNPELVASVVGRVDTLTATVYDKCNNVNTSAAMTYTRAPTAKASLSAVGTRKVAVTSLATGAVYIYAATGSIKDSTRIDITTGGTTYFLATAENGSVTDPWHPTYTPFGNGGIIAANSTTRAKNGTRSYKFEIPAAGAPTNQHYSQLFAGDPQTSMGGPSGHFYTGWYSFWAYIDAGYTQPDWNMLLGWMTGVSGSPSPISSIELRMPPAGSPQVLQLSFRLINATAGNYTAPNISGYSNVSNGYYFMTTSSPAGVVAFPSNQWVHISAYYKISASNGEVQIWQNGVKIMDLTAPTFDTFGGSTYTPLTNTAGDMMLQFGIYGAPQIGDQRLFSDDFTVSSGRVVP
ncbi:MAG: heparin lyase I family protein [Sphingosinicella sp.]|nr:heparin lyase I family protein [Sphingosinicella sp.]